MIPQSIVAIDFGSAFTKVAIRTGFGGRATPRRNIELAEEPGSIVIPTVVTQMKDGRWMAGQVAAEQPLAGNVRVYENWKKKLFAVDDATEPAVEIVEAATQFFRILRGAVESSAPSVESVAGISGIKCRVCVPDLAGSQSAKKRLLDILFRSGWQPEDETPFISEPESNTIGIVTRGRNVTFKPTPVSWTYTPDISPNYQAMFDPMFSKAFRHGALGTSRHTIGVMVTDVGAFTTDFAYVQFDASFATEASKPTVKSQSYRLGIRELDEVVLAGLSEDARVARYDESLAWWERTKRHLYSGGSPRQLAKKGGGLTTIGTPQEIEMIRGESISFGDRVWRQREEFHSSLGEPIIDAEILTGGGMFVSGVRETLTRKLAQTETRVFDLLDRNEPAPLALKSLMEVDARLTENNELMRAASAVGACSVFFEGARLKPRAASVPSTRQAALTIDELQITAQEGVDAPRDIPLLGPVFLYDPGCHACVRTVAAVLARGGSEGTMYFAAVDGVIGRGLLSTISSQHDLAAAIVYEKPGTASGNHLATGFDASLRLAGLTGGWRRVMITLIQMLPVGAHEKALRMLEGHRHGTATVLPFRIASNDRQRFLDWLQ